MQLKKITFALENLREFGSVKYIQPQYDFIRQQMGLGKEKYSLESLNELVYLTKSLESHDDGVAYLSIIEHEQEKLNRGLESILDEYNQIPSLESGEKDPSFFKKIWNKIKEMLSKFKDWFLGFIGNLGSSILSFIGSAKINKDIDTLEKLGSIDYLTEKDFTKAIKKLFNLDIYGTLDKATLFNKNGRMHEIPFVLKNTEGFFSVFSDFIKNNGKMKDEFLTAVEHDEREKLERLGEFLGNSILPEDNMRDSSYLHYIRNDILKGDYDKSLNNFLVFDKISFDKDHFFKQVEGLKKNANSVESFYKKVSGQLKPYVKNMERELDNPKEVPDQYLGDYLKFIRKLIHSCMIALKVTAYPVQLVSVVSRVVASMTKTLVDHEFSTTLEGPNVPIYHLSDNGKLKSPMEPRIGGTNYNEFLPARISFSTGILNACIGIPRYFRKPKNSFPMKDGLAYVDFWLYEGKPVDGETKYIKPELSLYGLPDLFQTHLKEVSVASPIEVENKGKVRIYFDIENKDVHDLKRYVRYEMLNE